MLRGHTGRRRGVRHERTWLSKTIVIDYSSPNIAKEFRVFHLRTTVLGHALYNIFGALGYRVVGINHLGDWGKEPMITLLGRTALEVAERAVEIAKRLSGTSA